MVMSFVKASSVLCNLETSAEVDNNRMLSCCPVHDVFSLTLGNIMAFEMFSFASVWRVVTYFL